MISRVLVVGSGGREHALAWRLARDPGSPEVLVAPGNDGMAESFRRLDAPASDGAALAAACRDAGVELVVIGPEAPLAEGLADVLASSGLAVFGASREAAKLEASKWHAKTVMREAGVPTARAEVFTSPDAAIAALPRFGPPWVVKADGLAAGKGVRVTSERADAERFVRACLEPGRHDAGPAAVVLEEFLAGEEASVMAVCDGARFVLLPAARDYKRARDGDQGPNTGGMGSYAPEPAVDAGLERTIGERIVTPVLRACAARGAPFRGLLYCGLMLADGGPRVVEFNVRFGDPETQSVLPLVEGSLSELLASAARGALEPAHVRRAAGAAVTIALVDEGYPEALRGGGAIEGLELVAAPDLLVFHAGTRRERGRWIVSGGRAAYLTALAPTLERARERAYAARARLSGEGWRCRADVAAAVAQPRRGATTA